MALCNFLLTICCFDTRNRPIFFRLIWKNTGPRVECYPAGLHRDLWLGADQRMNSRQSRFHSFIQFHCHENLLSSVYIFFFISLAERKLLYLHKYLFHKKYGIYVNIQITVYYRSSCLWTMLTMRPQLSRCNSYIFKCCNLYWNL